MLRDKVMIAELEAKCYVYETALAAAGLQPLQLNKKPRKREAGFKFTRKEN